jgi:Domain of unknown function (DUF5658)
MLATHPAPELAVAASERRTTDRRRRPTPMFSRYTWFGGRRQHVRRLEDDQEVFVDRYGSGLLLAVLGVVLLNLADAFFTLLFLAHGGQEMNPIVDQVLAYGPHVFILFKTLGIGVCAGFLTLTKNFRAARIGLWIVLIGYSLLLCWHLLLLATRAAAKPAHRALGGGWTRLFPVATRTGITAPRVRHLRRAELVARAAAGRARIAPSPGARRAAMARP